MTEAELTQAGQSARGRPIETLYASDPDRLARFTLSVGPIHADLSKAQMSGAELEGLLAFAKERGVMARMAEMFAGAPVNLTEGRAVMHMALRDPSRAWSAKGQPVSADVAEAQARVSAFAQGVRDGAILASDGRPFASVLHLGIGGSDLGPRLVHEALETRTAQDITLRFAANVEPGEFAAAVHGLDPRETLVVCVSKTFTTPETMANLDAAQTWLRKARVADPGGHLAAVSAAPDKAAMRGLAADRVFGFGEWVGGRFSLWSAVGLSLEIALGVETIARLRAGAAMMDQHAIRTPPDANLPLRLALQTWWNRNALGLTSRAVIPYARRLRLLPAFLQQLDMESNGKGTGLDGAPVAMSCPVVWGAEGTNAQHAFFQHLHQSPDITPVEFVAVAADDERAPERTRMTLANVLAQAEALMRGKPLDAVRRDMEAAGAESSQIARVAPHRVFAGGRPSHLLLLDTLTPESLGALLALNEHRAAMEGALWGVNSFDQWGVELGKVIASEIDEDLRNGPSSARDPATAALIRRLRGR